MAYVKPSLLCTIQDSRCIGSQYPIPKDTITVDVSDDQSAPPPNILDPDAKPKYLLGPVSSLNLLPLCSYVKYLSNKKSRCNDIVFCSGPCSGGKEKLTYSKNFLL